MLNIRPVSDLRNKYPEIEAKMTKAVTVLEEQLHTLRAGRANPAVLDKVVVDYYGAPTPVNQLAAVSVTEARTLMIQPWDASVLTQIERAIQMSDIGINPQNDGKALRMVFPPLTEERRKMLCKDVSKTAEESKVAIRSIRRDAIDKIKAMKKNSEITEDDQKNAETKIQKITDEFIKEIDGIADKKEKEIMEI